MNLAELTQVALLGTERQALVAPNDEAAIADLLRKLDYAQNEEALLSAAALTTAYERAGRLPAHDVAPAASACPAEKLRWASPRARALLRRLLDGDHPRVLTESLALAGNADVLAPPELLPSLLNTGAQEQTLQTLILKVIGERGRWLAAQNPDWSWVAGGREDESIWQTGAAPARVLFLRQLRRTQPDRALELLVSTWKEESPQDRAELIAELETGLNPNDESFLESALDDKRKEVRRTASRLLARLPASALVKRITDRVAPLLVFTAGKPGGLLRMGKKPTLEVTLPAECDKSMQRDGIEPKASQGFGEKAWWLIQLLQVVPLDFWPRHWNTTPSEILSATLLGEWKKELVEAWTQAAMLQRNAIWAEALFKVALEQRQVGRFHGLLLALPVTDRENRVAELLDRDESSIVEMHPMLLAGCGDRWSVDFSRAVLRWLRQLTAQKSTDWTLRSQLKEYACCLNPAVLPAAAQDWKTHEPDWEFWSKGMDDFLSIVHLRSEIHTAFNSLTP